MVLIFLLGFKGVLKDLVTSQVGVVTGAIKHTSDYTGPVMLAVIRNITNFQVGVELPLN